MLRRQVTQCLFSHQRMSIKTDFPDKWRTVPYQRIAYGYKPSDEDPLHLIPDEDIAPFVIEALDFIDSGGSYREAAGWLTQMTGKKISHQGICNIWKERRGKTTGAKRVKRQKDQVKKFAPKTALEKKKAAIRRKAADAKRVVAMQKKKLQSLEGTNNTDVTGETLGTPVTDSLDFDAAPKEAEVIFKPNKGPQTEFLAASEREVLYGGSAGSGKSYALLADPMRYFGNKNFTGLILRRTTDELRELIWKSHELYPKAYKGAKWQERKSQWVFPSGAKLWFTYVDRDEDVLRYQGQSFSYIAFDELTQHPTPFVYNYLRSRLRTTDPDLPIFMRATTNPGSSGHSWVKRMFIDPAPAGRAFDATDIDTGEVLTYPESHPKAGQALFQRRFIPAKLYDNPYLAEDGQYEANLLSLPEHQRRQLLEGDWSIAEGAKFSEFRTSTHTCEPFDIPTDWRRFRSCDYGYSSWSAVHWYAIDPSYETLYVYRELYVSKHTGRDLAQAVLNIEREENDKVDYGVLDSSCWHKRGQIGPSIAEEMIMAGCRWRPSDRTAGARISGANRLHELLKVDPVTEKAGIIFFETCRQIIAELPLLPMDPKGTDDIDPRAPNDHCYDSIRYGIMSRPKAFSLFDMPDNKPEYRYRPADIRFGY